MLLDYNPCLAKYSTFGGLNSSLHFAASKGHNEIVALLLENGADVNSRNYCGQTALMQACRNGQWEVVQTLLLFRCNVTSIFSKQEVCSPFCSCQWTCAVWLPLDVARLWGCHRLETLLNPNSDMQIPNFPSSNYLSLPLMSVLNIARECGLQFSTSASEDAEICAVCLERACTVAAEGVLCKIRVIPLFNPTWFHPLSSVQTLDHLFRKIAWFSGEGDETTSIN